MIVSPLLCLLFITLATLALLLFGYLTHQGVFGADAFPDFFSTLPLRQRALMRAWIIGGGLLGVVFPLGAVILWHTSGIIVSMLLPFIGVLLIQVLSERLLVRRFGPLLSPVTGLIYTAFRVFHLILLLVYWQKAAALLVPETHTTITALLGMNALFWSCNLLFLVSILLPRMVMFRSRMHHT